MKSLVFVVAIVVLSLLAYSCGIKTCAPPPPPGGYSYDWVKDKGQKGDKR